MPSSRSPAKPLWEPTAKQAEYLAAGEDEVLYGGAAGGGKTDALVIDAMGGQQGAVYNPIYRALLLRRTFAELKEVKDRAQAIYPVLVPGAVHVSSDNEWRFPSGARIEFGYLQSETDVMQYQSRQFQFLGWEELTQWPTSYAYEYMQSRLRAPERANLVCYTRATTNPGGPGEKWVRARFRIDDIGTATCFYVEAEGRKFWRRFLPATLRDNPHITAEYRQRLLLLPEADREALLNGRWGIINVPGAIYGADLGRMREEGRITRVPHDPRIPVETYWDLGYGDHTAIWCRQRVGPEIRCIAYYEANKQSFDHYAQWLADKKWTFSRHVLPHDAASKWLGTGKSIEEIAKDLLTGKVEVGPRLDVEDRINATRMMFPRVWIDETGCADGLRALQHYRREYSDKLGQDKPVPLHDWASHGSDAFGYMALDAEKPERQKRQQQERRAPVAGGWMR